MGMFGDIGNTGSQMTGAGVDIVMSLIGSAMAAGDYQKAHDLYQNYYDQINGAQGPQWQQQTAQEDDAPQNIAIKSQGRTAQSQALAKLQAFADQGGLDAQGRQALQQTLGASDQQAQAQRGAIMQGSARKGMQGSGSELAAMLQGQQGASNASRNSGLGIAGQARQNALGALTSSGTLAGQMRGQDISTQAQNANAEAARQQFNAKMRQAANSQNAQGAFTQYDAQLAHLQQLGQANSQLAGDDINKAKRTQGQWSSVGQGLDYGFQAAGEGSSNMPF